MYEILLAVQKIIIIIACFLHSTHTIYLSFLAHLLLVNGDFQFLGELQHHFRGNYSFFRGNYSFSARAVFLHRRAQRATRRYQGVTSIRTDREV